MKSKFPVFRSKNRLLYCFRENRNAWLPTSDDVSGLE